MNQLLVFEGPRSVPPVSSLSAEIRELVTALPAGWVEGELQEAHTASSGHCYLTLADDKAQIKGVIWRRDLRDLTPLPKTGALIQVHYSRIDFYPPHGSVSLHIDDLRETGQGELLQRRAETLLRLEREGLTDRRRALPEFPRRVGVIAANKSAAQADVVRALIERWPPVRIVLAPALVEGVNAVNSMIGALKSLQADSEVDVIILARGGGGVQELVPFDDERLCRAVSASPVPIVSAVAHTPQRPNVDFVSDAYAHVPAKTAELVVPSLELTRARIDDLNHALDIVPRRCNETRALIDVLQSSLRPKLVADPIKTRVALLASEIAKSARHRHQSLVVDARHLGELIEARDLRRHGWVMVTRDGEPIRSVDQLSANDNLELSFYNGSVRVRVE